MSATPSFFVVDDEVQRFKQLQELAVEFAAVVVGDEPSALEVSVLSGGLTNQLYRVKNPIAHSRSVVVRVFGKETERIISRDAELFWQSAFIKTFGRKGNALVYEFLEGYKDLHHTEMPVHAKSIAREVAAYHVRASSAALGQLPYATELNFSREILTKWVNVATSSDTISRLAPAKRAQYESFTIKDRVHEEAATLLRLLNAYERHLPQGACHNDLLCANVMLKRDDASNTIKLIDFEYAKRNFLYYDIANHFNEYTGFDCDWAAYYPDGDKQAEFVRAYLIELRRLTQPSARPLDPADEDALVVRVCTLVRFFMLVSHLCWMLWSIIQQAFSVIDFDYLSYGGVRWARFLDTKEAILAELAAAVPLDA